MVKKSVKSTKKKQIKIVPKAVVHINSSFNNTLICAADENGNVFAWSSTGRAGFKGTKKSTPFASTQAAKLIIEKMQESQVAEIQLFVAGVSSGRDAAIRAFGQAGFRVSKIKDITPLPHNGCRPKKPRRV
ncbi:MAG: 30S ribosomal protein S11 [Candidatus Berkelbacteria bacterium]|nr:30S ribosomal protein S11 [Candidatus Berkelbacteria bacterium]